MSATIIATEDRKHFVFLFDLGIEYFNTCIAGDPREAARSLEYPASVYHALHAKLSETVHSDATLTARAFGAHGLELLGELVDMGASDYEYMIEREPDQIRTRYTDRIGGQPSSDIDDIHTRLVKQAHAISFGH